MSITIDKYGVLRDSDYPNATFGNAHPTQYERITLRTVTMNGRCTWGSRLECKQCGRVAVQLVGSSVSYEDGPHHFSRHDCEESMPIGSDR